MKKRGKRSGEETLLHPWLQKKPSMASLKVKRSMLAAERKTAGAGQKKDGMRK
jgi:hypothetical protein